MERRKFIRQAGAAVAFAGVGGGVLAACAPPTSNQESNNSENQEPTGNMENKEVIAHYVLFWLNNDLSEQEVVDFANFFEELKGIPGIKSLHYGRAAQTHERDVVDNSFTYNLLVFFDTMEDIDTYETHPVHLEAIEKYSKNWNKVVVHDSWLKQAVV